MLALFLALSLSQNFSAPMCGAAELAEGGTCYSCAVAEEVEAQLCYLRCSGNQRLNGTLTVTGNIDSSDGSNGCVYVGPVANMTKFCNSGASAIINAGPSFQLVFNAGSGSLSAPVGATSSSGTIVVVASAQFTAVGNAADTTEDNLMTYSLPAGSMSANGRGVRVTAWGDGVNTADATTVKCYFGATQTVTQTLPPSAANTWRSVFEVLRTGAATQIATSDMMVTGTTFTQKNSSPGETLSGAVVIKCTGQRATTATANSVRQLGMLVEFIN